MPLATAVCTDADTGTSCPDDVFDADLQNKAAAFCQDQGYRRATNAATVPGTEAWADRDLLPLASNQFNLRAWRTREYTTTCVKTVRKRRR